MLRQNHIVFAYPASHLLGNIVSTQDAIDAVDWIKLLGGAKVSSLN